MQSPCRVIGLQRSALACFPTSGLLRRTRQLPFLLALMLLPAAQLSAQALYELDRLGSLKRLEQRDATVRNGEAGQPVLYSLDGGGILTGSDWPGSVAQQPGAEVVLQTSPGRRLAVMGRIVNVRTGPALSADVRTQLERGTQVISVEHDGTWVRVSYPGSEEAVGWIYEPLLAEVFGYSAPQGNTPLSRFRNALRQLREEEDTAALYTGLEAPRLGGSASVSLIASEAWLKGQEADRWDAAAELGLRWRKFTPAGEMAVLNILDGSGERQMTVIRP